MRITVVSYGSLGDVRPIVALGLGLRTAGHEVVGLRQQRRRPGAQGGHPGERVSDRRLTQSPARAIHPRALKRPADALQRAADGPVEEFREAPRAQRAGEELPGRLQRLKCRRGPSNSP